MGFPAPVAPAAFPEGQAVTFPGALRYEDVTQDGHLLPIALPPTLGGLWQHVLARHPGSRNALAQGIVPILTRLTLTAHAQPIQVDRPIEVDAGFELAHAGAPDAVTKLYMNAWCEVRGAAGRMTPGQAAGPAAGPLALAGHLFAEHTFTRLLAPPEARRVTRLAVEGYPEVPATRYDAPPPASAGEAPAGARWLGALEPDAAEVCFTLDHTDSNLHVNSLVYVRVFLEAVGRRLAVTGHGLRVRSRAVDIGYRKPCFAGDRVRAHVRLFEDGDGLGAAGLIAGDDGKPRCHVRVRLGA